MDPASSCISGVGHPAAPPAAPPCRRRTSRRSCAGWTERIARFWYSFPKRNTSAFALTGNCRESWPAGQLVAYFLTSPLSLISYVAYFLSPEGAPGATFVGHRASLPDAAVPSGFVSDTRSLDLFEGGGCTSNCTLYARSIRLWIA